MSAAKTKRRRTLRHPAGPRAVEALVAFIDLLGFSEKVLAVRSAADLERLAATIARIQEYFDYRPADETTREAQAISKTEVLAFSDSVIVSIVLESAATATQGEFDVWGSDLNVMAYAQGKAAAAGRFIRGGLDRGLWFHEGDTLVSPALVRAHRLESSKAKYPVLAVSNSLFEFLRDHPGRKVYSSDLDPFPTMFRSFTDVADETVHYLNYMQLLLDDVDWQSDRQTVAAYRAASPDEKDDIAREGFRKNRERFLRDHRDAIVSGYQGAGSDNVRAKYVFLRDYHNEIVDLYFERRNDLKVSFDDANARRRPPARRVLARRRK